MNDSKKEVSITEKSLIPISLVIAIISVALWVGGLGSDVKSIAKSVDKHEIQIEKLRDEDIKIRKTLNETLIQVNGRLGRIEGAMGIENKTP